MAIYEGPIGSPVVSIQGEVGSYHDKAARYYFGQDYQPIGCDNFPKVFAAVESGEADFGLSAVENSIYGDIGEVHGLLRDADISIIGEVTLGIHHSLIGLPEASLEGITDVHSHKVALAQCGDFIRNVLGGARTHEEADTAGSVPLVKKLGTVSAAAIAPNDTAEQYGMKVLQTNVEDNPENYTRFLVLQQGAGIRTPDANKTSLLVEDLGRGPAQKAGQIQRLMASFALNGVELVRFAPQPLTGRPWQPQYFVDLAAGTADARMRAAQEDLVDAGIRSRILGSYRKGATL